jgi:hypothetical protein
MGRAFSRQAGSRFNDGEGRMGKLDPGTADHGARRPWHRRPFVALSHMSAVREGIPVSVNVVSVFHFRDGRQQERWFHPPDIVAWDRLLGGPV